VPTRVLNPDSFTAFQFGVNSRPSCLPAQSPAFAIIALKSYLSFYSLKKLFN
jgi:hypothetical protein